MMIFRVLQRPARRFLPSPGRTTRITCLVHVICHIYDMSHDVRVGLAYGCRVGLTSRMTCLVQMICHMGDTSYDVLDVIEF